jgi:hypothetical protein
LPLTVSITTTDQLEDKQTSMKEGVKEKLAKTTAIQWERGV